MTDPNPYSPTNHPDDRAWFSGFPRFVKRAAVVIAICIAVIVIADAAWIASVERSYAHRDTWVESVIGEEVVEYLKEYLPP